MGRLRVLHVTFDMGIGGTERVITQLVRNTSVSKFDVAVVCLDGKIGELGRELLEEGYRVSTLERRPGFDFRLILALRRLVIGEMIDIVHCHQYAPYVYGLLAAVGTGSRVMFTEHGRFYPDTLKWRRALINPILSLRTSAIITISAATREALVKYENMPRRRISVIYNGLSVTGADGFDRVDVRQRLGIETGNLVLGTVSRLDPIKNQKMMLKAFSIVQAECPRTRLIVVGDGPSRVELEQYASELSVTRSVEFVGFKVNPQPYFAIMDVFLLSSLSEGTSMTLLEAMAFSKPCIATSVGGNPEVIVNGKTGLLVPADDADAFAAAIVKLIRDPNLCARFGHAGLLRYRELFCVKRMIESYEEVYQCS